jgi:hypothetical protein
MLKTLLVLCASALTLFAVRPVCAQDTSTPQERQQWADVVHKLAADPLNPELNDQAKAAVKRVMDVKDFHVVVCADAFTQVQNVGKKLRVSMMNLYMLGTAAFVVEHPDQANDSFHSNLAGLTDVVQAYGVILTQSPKDKDKTLDKLAESEKSGALATDLQAKCKAPVSPPAGQ